MASLAHGLEARAERLAAGRRTAPLVAVVKRFQEIDGLDLGVLVAVELFTVVIPLTVLGFGFASDFSEDLSFGDVLIRRLRLDGETGDLVRSAFSDNANLQSSWTLVGLAGWLLWGLGTSSVMARAYAKAWRRERFPMLTELWRGLVWFLSYLAVLAVSESTLVRAASRGGLEHPVLGFVLGLVPIFAFWALSPVLLVRDGGAGRRALLLSGLAGLVIEGVVLRVAAVVALPPLLSGWVDFGPIGVAMALMTWCGVQAVAWVVTACVSAVVWERTAPTEVALAVQTAPVEAAG